jgi:superfamily II DNA/RNA helicase
MYPVVANRSAALKTTGYNLTDTDPAQVEQDEILSGPKQSAAGHDPDKVDETSPVATEPEDSAPATQAVGEADGPDQYEYDDDDDDLEQDQDAAYAAHLAAPDEPARVVFADLGLSDEVLRAIADMGYRHPTPIQEQAIPVILMTRDVLGVAQTGTGKTAGFTLPMLDILAGSRARARMPRSLILEPTRELALQVAENFVQYGKYLKLTHALIIGGESMSDQREVLNRGVDVLIATPGRLIDMFERGTILLTDTRILVIDEADRMLDMGFIPDVERIVSLLPTTRQTLFFSATMGPEIKRLADAFLQNPKEITVSRSATVAVGITEGLALVAEHDKREALRRLIRTQNVQNALIFCNRKTEVDILHKSLVRHKFSAGALHGDMAQTVRFTTLEKFKAGELRLLVCSDVAARGLDIGGLSHVFNFDVPHHAEDYVHRIGRTGRAGLEGHAFTIAMPEDRMAVEAIEKLTGHPIPPMIVEGLDPVDWAEFDGRKRRGRKAPAGKKAPPAKTARGKRSSRDQARTPDAANAAQPGHAAEITAPARELGLANAPSLAAAPEADAHPRAHAPQPRNRDSAPRMRQPRGEPKRDEPGHEAAASRDRPPERDERPAEHRRERFRQDDLGPAVVGFGDDIPAFMMVRRMVPVPETDA